MRHVMRLPGQLYAIVRHPMNRGAPLRALRRWAAWQIGSRIAPGAILVPFVNGTVLYATPGLKGVTGNIYYGLGEFEEMALTAHLLREGDLFVDVGANVGSYTVLASAVLGAWTEAFEPVPVTADILEMNIRLNGISDRVSVHRLALGAQPSEVRFTTDLDTCNHVAIGDEAGILVRIETLDNVLRGKCPLLIKMDVEGYEPEVLKGAEATLGNPNLLAVIAETNGGYRCYGYELNDVLGPLTDLGFRSIEYNPHTRKATWAPQREHSRGNTILARDLQLVRNRLEAAPAVLTLAGEI
jgi:FkbM family methyltransferase